MHPSTPNLSTAIATLVALLEAALQAYARAIADRRRGRSGRVWQRDLDRLLDEIIPEALVAEDGRDGRVLWMLAILAFAERRELLDAALLQVARDLPRTADHGVVWRRFRRLGCSRRRRHR